MKKRRPWGVRMVLLISRRCEEPCVRGREPCGCVLAWGAINVCVCVCVRGSRDASRAAGAGPARPAACLPSQPRRTGSCSGSIEIPTEHYTTSPSPSPSPRAHRTAKTLQN